MTKTIVTLTGPTCSGKTTLQAMLEKEGLAGMVSFTTRKPRQGETEGKDYYFLTTEEYDNLKENQTEIVEEVILNGNHYGILKKEIDRNLNLSKNIVVVVEPNGAKQISVFCRENNLYHLAIYINAPPYVLYKRFLDRFYRDDKAVLDLYALRLTHLTYEITEWPSAFWYDVRFAYFDSTNQDSVVSQILHRINVQ